MSFRSLLAGPSRLPSHRPLLLLTSTPSRRNITIPHPDLSPSNGSTRLLVRTLDRIPSMVHAFAILRAVESHLGESAISIEVPKHVDTLAPGVIMYITLLRPTKLDKPLQLSIPSPQLSSASNYLGGPSLEDVEAALNRQGGETPTIGSTSTSSGDELHFRLEVLRKSAERPYTRRPRAKAPRNQRRDKMEDEAILSALEKFGGGFYGGFEGIVEKFGGSTGRQPPQRGNKEGEVEGDEEEWQFVPGKEEPVLGEEPSQAIPSSDPDQPLSSGSINIPTTSTTASSTSQPFSLSRHRPSPPPPPPAAIAISDDPDPLPIPDSAAEPLFPAPVSRKRDHKRRQAVESALKDLKAKQEADTHAAETAEREMSDVARRVKEKASKLSEAREGAGSHDAGGTGVASPREARRSEPIKPVEVRQQSSAEKARTGEDKKVNSEDKKVNSEDKKGGLFSGWFGGR